MATLDVPQRFNRAKHKDPDAAVDRRRFLIRHVCDTLGLADLSEQDVLDVGCGTRFTAGIPRAGACRSGATSAWTSTAR